jgi:hypothetical protein
MLVTVARAVARAPLEAFVERTIAPFVGASLARASTRAHAERLGINGADLTGEQVGTLLERLEKGLRVFVGSPKAAALITTIRDAVERGEIE